MPATTAANIELGRTVVQQFIQGYTNKTPAIHKQIIGKVISTKLAEYNYMEETGFGTAIQVAEGAALPVDSITTRNKKTLRGVKRALGFDVTTEALESDQYGVYKKYAAKFAKSFAKTRDYYFTNAFFNLAFTATDLSPDGISLYNSNGLSSGTGHATTDPTVRFNNRGVLVGTSYTDVAFGYMALEQACQTFTSAVDARGLADPMAGKKRLHVPPALQGVANRVVGATHLPQSADNDPAWASGQISQVVVNPFMTSTTAWFLVDENENPLFELNRRGYQVYSKDARADNDSYKFTATEMYAAGVERTQGTWGTTGA